MGAVTAAAIAGAATVGSAAMNNRAAGKASAAQNRASNSANALQSQVYENARGDLDPYLQAGTNALTGLNALANGDYSAFQNSPDYQFSLQQGTQALDRSAASRGALYSGGQLADLTSFGQGMASQNLGNYRNSLMGLANMGASAGSAMAGVGQNYAGAYGSNLNNAASAQGSNALSQGNNWGQALTGLAGLANNQLQGRTSSFTPAGNSLLGLQAASGQGSAYNVGNNLNSLVNWRK